MGLVGDAKDILTYAAVPEAIVQVICLPFGFRVVSERRTLETRKGLLAIGAGVISLIVSLVVVLLMIPVAWRSLVTNRGRVDPVLVFFWMLLLVFVGCGLTGAVLLRHALDYYRKARAPGR